MEPPLPGYYQYFRGVKCFTQGHNTAEVGFEHPTGFLAPQLIFKLIYNNLLLVWQNVFWHMHVLKYLNFPKFLDN